MSWDNIWEKVFQKEEWGKYPPECLIRFIAKNFYGKVRKNVRILEVGCGPGANIWYMAREGFDTYGVDGSPTAIERAIRRIKEDGLTAELKVSDAEKLPYPASYFNAVVDNECLAHNSKESAKIILREIKRVLKKGGLFFSRTFTDKTYIGNSQEKMSSLEFKEVSEGTFADRGFIRLIAKGGIRGLYGKYFKIVSIDKLEYSMNDEKQLSSEWIINCQKEV